MDPVQLETLTLSATSLGVLDQCPRLFRCLYIDRLIWPPGLALEEEESLRLGRLFHRLVELHSQGLSIETQLRAIPPQVQIWWQIFLDSPHAGPQGQVFSEIPLWIQVEGVILTAQLDRLVVTETGVEIIDWKTDRIRPSETQMHRNRQTWLYPLMVCLVGDRLPDGTEFSPDDIQITFWYVNYPQHPWQRTYSQAQLQRHRGALHRVLDTLKQAHREDYPMTRSTSICQSCLFRTRCYGLVPEGLDLHQLDLFEGLLPPPASVDLESPLDLQR